MIQPTRMILSYLLTSLFYFFGGLIMIFLTSWRLAILAATTIGPIALIYRFYLEWSRKVSRYLSILEAMVFQHLTSCSVKCGLPQDMRTVLRIRPSPIFGL